MYLGKYYHHTGQRRPVIYTTDREYHLALKDLANQEPDAEGGLEALPTATGEHALPDIEVPLPNEDPQLANAPAPVDEQPVLNTDVNDVRFTLAKALKFGRLRGHPRLLNGLYRRSLKPVPCFPMIASILF
jgi:hypothetical protein